MRKREKGDGIVHPTRPSPKKKNIKHRFPETINLERKTKRSPKHEKPNRERISFVSSQ